MSRQRVLIDGKKYFIHPVFSNYAASKEGEVINMKTGRIMKMRDNGFGYLRFTYSDNKLEKPKKYLVHRFVYEAIKGAIPEGFEIDHRNNCREDNRINNLQLLTHKQNIEKSHNKAIISINIESGEERNYISIKSASIELNINFRIISAICRKERYRKSATSKNYGQKYRFEFLK